MILKAKSLSANVKFSVIVFEVFYVVWKIYPPVHGVLVEGRGVGMQSRICVLNHPLPV
jgi:bacteriorhodopsin